MLNHQQEEMNKFIVAQQESAIHSKIVLRGSNQIVLLVLEILNKLHQ